MWLRQARSRSRAPRSVPHSHARGARAGGATRGTPVLVAATHSEAHGSRNAVGSGRASGRKPRSTRQLLHRQPHRRPLPPRSPRGVRGALARHRRRCSASRVRTFPSRPPRRSTPSRARLPQLKATHRPNRRPRVIARAPAFAYDSANEPLPMIHRRKKALRGLALLVLLAAAWLGYRLLTLNG